MRSPLVALAFSCIAACAWSQESKRPSAEVLGFETTIDGRPGGGWSADPAQTVFIDRDIVHGGRQSLRFERRAGSPDALSAATYAMPIDFKAEQIELRGYLKAEDVDGMTGLWIVEDNADDRYIAFDNMDARPLKGTSDWAPFSVKIAVRPDARTLRFGALMIGTGKAWVDDLQLLVDGTSIDKVAKPSMPSTALDLDHRFDGGSKVDFTALDAMQADRLVLLAKVWGFLKYHDPRVTSGQRHWDYDLLAVLPDVLAAKSDAQFRQTMFEWVDGLGPVIRCTECARPGKDVAYPADLQWLSDVASLGRPLSQRLREIHANRPEIASQFYVSKVPLVGRPSFDHEPDYAGVPLSDRGFRLLAAFRFWNAVQYWSPYRDLLGGTWEQTLRDVLPAIVSAGDDRSYQRALIALIAKLHDSHTALWSSLAARPPEGNCGVPVRLRYVENHWVVVSGIAPSSNDEALERGDAIVAVDGRPVEDLVESWRPYYAASNEASFHRDFAAGLVRGPCGDVRLDVEREQKRTTMRARRVADDAPDPFAVHDLQGPTFRRLSDDVAYLKLSSTSQADVAGIIASIASTRGLIVDIRNYPSDYVVYALGSLLVDRPTPFASFITNTIANPGEFTWGSPIVLEPQQPHYGGRVVVLVDEISQSRAEYTTLALRAAPRTVVVGSMTAGADGDVASLKLPGRMSTLISGNGYFWPDRRPTQRVGIAADIHAEPTIAGIRAGRDEVLEAGLRELVGADEARRLVDRLARP